MPPVTPPASPQPAARGADVFISYARENRALAAQLAAALTGHGLQVWWDRELIAGTRFSERIEQELGGARCVLTLWSADSVRSGFVRDESSRALESGKLIPLRIEAVQLPLGFGQLHTVDLIDWDGDADDPRIAELLTAIAAPRDTGDATPDTTPEATARRQPAAGRPRWRLVALAAAVACALAGGGLAWKRQADAAAAEQQFLSALENQFGREPNLERARNLYLSALARQPQHARARYYLGHVYAQLGQTDLARSTFQQALQQPDQLDAAQLADAGRQVAALSPAQEPAAVDTRVADARTGTAATGAPPAPAATPPVARPAPAVVPSPPASASPAPTGPTSAERLPPRLPLAADSSGRLAAQVSALFEGDRASRISATTSLILDPAALSDAVPLALAQALPLAALPQPNDTQLSGVINTLVLLQNALPATLLAQRSDITRLIDAARPQGPATRLQADKLAELLQQAVGQRPTAYIQIADESQRALAQALAQRLQERGYAAPGIEVVGAARAPQRSEIRVHGKSDRGLARWLAKVLDDFTVDAPGIRTLRNTRPRSDTFEIWLGAGVCHDGGQLARCQAAP